MTAAPTPSQGVTWWTAAEVYTWAAFRNPRKLLSRDADGNERWMDCIEFPADKWAVNWKQPPRPGLTRAFEAIAAEQRLGAEGWDSRGRAHYLHWAWRIIRETGQSAEYLQARLLEHFEQLARNQDELRRAFRDVMDKVRSGLLTVRARRTLQNGAPDAGAAHEKLDHDRWFVDGARAISLHGKVEYVGEGHARYDGPRWDEVRFDAEQVQAFWLPVIEAQPEILEWLVSATEASMAKGKGRPKKNDLVTSCSVALKRPIRKVAAVYQTMPSHLRRGQGDRTP